MMLSNLDKPLPLCVDLDGTLLRTDVTQESLLLILLKKPHFIFKILWWFIQGRAVLKQRLADYVVPVPSKLPLNYIFLEYLEEEKQKGVSLYLVTAADQAPAQAIANYLGLFDEVFASDGHTNLRHEAKGNFLVHRFGEKGFIYAGNSHDDLMVWRYAAKAIAVNTPLNVKAILNRMAMPVHFIQDGHFSWLKMVHIFNKRISSVALLLMFFIDWTVGAFFLSSLSLIRLIRTMLFLRTDRVQPLTSLRVDLLLGHMPLGRAWLGAGVLAAIMIYSLKGMIHFFM